MEAAERYMHRCIHLARLGQGAVAPNPMVGAVLVHNDRIIGEGYHRKYGQPHAEVNCIESVKSDDRKLISEATMYVSLEPCAHFGKTPPCADHIIAEGIKHVVVGCRDPFPEVDGKGIEKLRSAGVKVDLGVLEDECRQLNKSFFVYHTEHRPYVVLKWAQTANGKIGRPGSRLLITEDAANRIVHKWRSEAGAILVGTNTALLDDPSLTTRLWPGPHPMRAVIDLQLRLPNTLSLFDGSVPTVVFNLYRHDEEGFSEGKEFPVHYFQVSPTGSLIIQILHALYHMRILSLLVEGGARVLQQFIDEGLWDEARTITNETLFVEEGLSSPQMRNFSLKSQSNQGNDRFDFFIHEEKPSY